MEIAMIDKISDPSTKKIRSRALLGSALALVLGAGVIGGAVLPTQTSPALAEAVQVQGVQPISFADVVDKVRPAVVSVRVKSVAKNDDATAEDGEFPFFDIPEGSPMEKFFKQFRGDPRGPGGPGFEFRRGNRPSMSLGSGFFISEDGYVVTNDHVVKEGQTMTVILDDGTEYNAKVIGVDEKTDLALLKVDADRKFTYVKFAEDNVRVGDWVVAVGNPFGLGGTVTAGIISANGRQIGAGPYDDFIQIDAAVNRGNSGGPAFNFRGEVIGINTAIFSPSGGNVGIAFAIPAHMAERVIDSLKEHGSVTRGWLGVQIQPVNQDIADSLRLSSDSGALVTESQSGSPAEKAGIKTGDTILAVDGKDVKGPRELALTIADMAPGTTVKVTYWRDGKKADADVTLGKLPDQQMASAEEPSQPQAAPSALEDFGMSIAPADDSSGVVITDVDPNGQAAERGLQPGDVILSVGDATVKDPAAVEKKMADAKAGGLKAVLLRVQSGDQTRFVALSFARA
jgi:serine protease Do